MIAPMTMATISKAPRMYLLAANHDSDCRPELKKRVELSELTEFTGVSGMVGAGTAAVSAAIGAGSIGAGGKFCGFAIAADEAAGVAACRLLDSPGRAEVLFEAEATTGCESR